MRADGMRRREFLRGSAGLAIGGSLLGDRVRVGWHPEHAHVLR
jgi:hypothetical protein